MTTSESGNPPKPTPRPGPRPVPRPGPVAPTAPVAPSVPSTADPHRFGRVDPDGTVWLITSSGERQIGSWQAGDTEAAYAHFGRRFDDLHTEVVLMERRLESGTGDARKIKAAASTLAAERGASGCPPSSPVPSACRKPVTCCRVAWSGAWTPCWASQPR